LAQNEITVGLLAARQALAEKRIDDAIALLRGVHDRSPSSADAASMLGAAYGEKKEFANALLWFKTAVSIQPTGRNYFNVAIAHRMLNSSDQSIAALRQALNLDPTYEKASQMLAQIRPTVAPVQPTAPVLTQPPPVIGVAPPEATIITAPPASTIGQPMAPPAYAPPTQVAY